jgi:thiol-disulfide isomerase/thioredoxin
MHNIRSVWKRIWRRRGWRYGIQLVLLLAVFIAIRSWGQRDLVSGPVPDLQGQLLDGGNFSLASRPARPLLIHFWASWCPVCRLEENSIAALSRDHAVITIAMQSGSDAEVRAYLEAQGLRFPVINDPEGRLARRFGVRAVPSSFIIDARDRIVFRETGFTSGPGLRLRMWWAQ